MNAIGFSAMSLALEVALALGLVLALCAKLQPRARVLLYRAVFALAALSPLTLILANHARPTLVTIATVPLSHIALSSPQAATPAPLNPSLWLLVLGVWVLGAAFLLTRILAAHLRLSLAFSAGTPLTGAHAALARELHRRLGLRRPVEVRFSKKAAAPCAFGCAFPKILLPVAMRESALQSVLTHEFCHIRNGDTAWLFVEHVACTLHWLNPLSWLCARRHRDDTELVCDDAATVIVSTRDYATALVQVAQDMLDSPAALAMSSHGLRERVHSLISRRGPLRTPSRFFRCVIAAGAVAATALLGATQIVSAVEPEMNDAVTTASVRPARGNGLVFVDAPELGRVEIGTTGACWDGARCVFEHRLGSVVQLHVTGANSSEWLGCDEIRGDACRVHISETPAHVSLRLAR